MAPQGEQGHASCLSWVTFILASHNLFQESLLFNVSAYLLV